MKSAGYLYFCSRIDNAETFIVGHCTDDILDEVIELITGPSQTYRIYHCLYLKQCEYVYKLLSIYVEPFAVEKGTHLIINAKQDDMHRCIEFVHRFADISSHTDNAINAPSESSARFAQLAQSPILVESESDKGDTTSAKLQQLLSADTRDLPKVMPDASDTDGITLLDDDDSCYVNDSNLINLSDSSSDFDIKQCDATAKVTAKLPRDGPVKSLKKTRKIPLASTITNKTPKQKLDQKEKYQCSIFSKIFEDGQIVENKLLGDVWTSKYSKSNNCLVCNNRKYFSLFSFVKAHAAELNVHLRHRSSWTVCTCIVNGMRIRASDYKASFELAKARKKYDMTYAGAKRRETLRYLLEDGQVIEHTHEADVWKCKYDAESNLLIMGRCAFRSIGAFVKTHYDRLQIKGRASCSNCMTFYNGVKISVAELKRIKNEEWSIKLAAANRDTTQPSAIMPQSSTSPTPALLHEDIRGDETDQTA